MGFAVGCGGFDCGGIVMVGLWVFSWWFAVDLQWKVCICSGF